MISFSTKKDSSSSSIDEKSLKQLLSNLIVLIYWPHENNIDEWICSLMSIMAVKAQNVQLLLTVCEENIDFVRFLKYLKFVMLNIKVKIFF